MRGSSNRQEVESEGEEERSGAGQKMKQMGAAERKTEQEGVKEEQEEREG